MSDEIEDPPNTQLPEEEAEEEEAELSGEEEEEESGSEEETDDSEEGEDEEEGELEDGAEEDGENEEEESEDEEDEDDEEEDEDGDDDDDEEEEEEDPIPDVSNAADSDSGGEEREICPICLNRLRQQDIGTPESCDHKFCLECIQEWAKNINTCPVDRQVFHLILARHVGEEKIFRQISVEDRRQAEEEEEPEDDDPTYCELCGNADREDRLLLCDGCDLGFHCDCLEPPLADVPVDEWFCPDCQLVRDQADLTLPRQTRRQVARTRVSERVRRVIADARIERAERQRRVIQMIEEQDVPEDEQPGPSTSTTTSPRARATGTTRKTTPRKKTTRKKTTRKKTTRKKTTRKKKTTKRKTTKRKTKAGTKRKRKTTKKRRKKTTKKTTKTTTSPARTVRMPPVSSVKGRIAERLGLSKPPVGRSIPMQKTSGGASRQEGPSGRMGDVGGASFSILGNRDDLYDFGEHEGVERQATQRPAIPAEAFLSRSAMSSHKPLSLKTTKKKVVVPAPPAAASSTAATASTSSPGFDLLGSIMQNQDLLAKGSRHVVISRDGSLTAAPSGTSPADLLVKKLASPTKNAKASKVSFSSSTPTSSSSSASVSSSTPSTSAKVTSNNGGGLGSSQNTTSPSKLKEGKNCSNEQSFLEHTESDDELANFDMESIPQENGAGSMPSTTSSDGREAVAADVNGASSGGRKSTSEESGEIEVKKEMNDTSYDYGQTSAFRDEGLRDLKQELGTDSGALSEPVNIKKEVRENSMSNSRHDMGDGELVHPGIHAESRAQHNTVADSRGDLGHSSGSDLLSSFQTESSTGNLKRNYDLLVSSRGNLAGYESGEEMDAGMISDNDREEGEATDSDGEERLGRSGFAADGDHDHEEGEILEDEETGGENARPSRRTGCADAEDENDGGLDVNAIHIEEMERGMYRKRSESQGSEPKDQSEDNNNEANKKGEKGEKDKKKEEKSDVSSEEEEEEESSEEEEVDPKQRGSFQMGTFLQSLVTNDFDRKKEQQRLKEEKKRQKEEEKRKRKAEKERLMREKEDKSQKKISILDFLGPSSAKFGVVPGGSSERGRGRGWGTKPLDSNRGMITREQVFGEGRGRPNWEGRNFEDPRSHQSRGWEDRKPGEAWKPRPEPNQFNSRSDSREPSRKRRTMDDRESRSHDAKFPRHREGRGRREESGDSRMRGERRDRRGDQGRVDRHSRRRHSGSQERGFSGSARREDRRGKRRRHEREAESTERRRSRDARRNGRKRRRPEVEQQQESSSNSDSSSSESAGEESEGNESHWNTSQTNGFSPEPSSDVPPSSPPLPGSPPPSPPPAPPSPPSAPPSPPPAQAVPYPGQHPEQPQGHPAGPSYPHGHPHPLRHPAAVRHPHPPVPSHPHTPGYPAPSHPHPQGHPAPSHPHPQGHPAPSHPHPQGHPAPASHPHPPHPHGHPVVHPPRHAGPQPHPHAHPQHAPRPRGPPATHPPAPVAHPQGQPRAQGHLAPQPQTRPQHPAPYPGHPSYRHPTHPYTTQAPAATTSHPPAQYQYPYQDPRAANPHQPPRPTQAAAPSHPPRPVPAPTYPPQHPRPTYPAQTAPRPGSQYPPQPGTGQHPQAYPAPRPTHPASHPHSTQGTHPGYYPQAHASNYPQASTHPASTTARVASYPGAPATTAYPQYGQHPSQTLRAQTSVSTVATSYAEASGAKAVPKPAAVERVAQGVSYGISPPPAPIRRVTTSDKITSSLLLDEVKKGFRQLVEDAVRSALKPFWSTKKVNKDEYKDIFKKSVEKVTASKETVVQQDKIQSLVEAYVGRARKARTS